jgi:hypothetical protein
MTKPIKLSVKIPFSGFYESSHDAEIDRAIESYFDTEGDGGNHVPEDFYFSFNHWKDIQRDYAKLYTELFSEWLSEETGLKVSFEYEEMTSPREYNFTTDRIFAKAPLVFFKKLRALVPDDVLEKQIITNHRSRSGFISFYSDDIETWKAKPLKEWDHNELGTLIEAAMIHAGVTDRGYAYDVMENALRNGKIDMIIDQYLPAWVALHPVDCAEDKIKTALDIPDDAWEAMSDDEKEQALEQYEALPARCEVRADMFTKNPR